MTNVVRASTSPNIPRPIWYALCAVWSVSLKTGYYVANEHHPPTASLSGTTHSELVSLDECFLLLHWIGTDTDDQNIGTLIYFLF